MNAALLQQSVSLFRSYFKLAPAVTAYAPGRVEVLGNHTDYNEGFVLSAAINFGTFFLAVPARDTLCRVLAGDLMEEVEFDVIDPAPSPTAPWSNYVRGVLAGLHANGQITHGFRGLLLGDTPQGAGLSSSAALEMACGLALAELYNIRLPSLALARLGQEAEHAFAGVRCGLLDQVSSLFGRHNRLVMIDFRTLGVETVPLDDDACFLMCNTKAKRALTEGAYNNRRRKCEEAVRLFREVLGHPVNALRDVSWDEWQHYNGKLEPVAARRAAHPIGENARVLKGRQLLAQGKLEEFGRLMFESHRSSQHYFENSCPELDFLVDAAEQIPGVLGARLSGGGFGGSAVVLIHPRDAEVIAQALTSAYRNRFGHPCDIRVIIPSDGAAVIEETP
jgi:galactokinase